MSMEETGTDDASTVTSPVIGSDREICVESFPVIRNPPVRQMPCQIYMLTPTAAQQKQVLIFSKKRSSKDRDANN